VTERRGVGRCPRSLSRGLYFPAAPSASSSGSYAAVDDSLRASPPSFSLAQFGPWTGFSATVAFRAAAPDALLLTAWHSPRCFASLALVDGQVRARLPSAAWSVGRSVGAEILSPHSTQFSFAESVGVLG